MRLRPEIILLAMGGLLAFAEIRARYVEAPLDKATWLPGDCKAYRDVARSILENGSVDYRKVKPAELERYRPGGKDFPPAGSNVAMTVDGTPVPHRSILLPLALVIPYAIAQEYGLLAFNVLQCVLLILIVYWLARRYSDEIPALLAACGFMALSVIRPFMYDASPDVFGAVLVLGGLLLVWKDGAKRWQLLAGGILFGLSVWLRPLNLMTLLAFLPAGVASARRRRLLPELLWPVLGFVAGSSGHFILNTLWFGSPLVTSYDRTLILKDGVQVLASLRDHMNRPFWESLIPTFFTHPLGFLQIAPYWLLFVLALPAIARRQPLEAATLAVFTFAPVLFLVKYDYWHTARFGNRFMFVPAAIAAIGIAWLVGGKADVRLAPQVEAGKTDEAGRRRKRSHGRR